MALGAPWIVVAASVVFAGVAGVIYTQLPEQLTPNEDRGVIPISVSAPQGVRRLHGYADAADRGRGRAVRESGEVTNMFLLAGQQSTNSGFVVLTLAPWEERSRSAQDIIKELNPKLQKLAGVQVSMRSANSLGIRGGGQGLRFAITGNDYNSLADKAIELQQALEDDADLRHGAAELRHHAARAFGADRPRKASDLGISVDTLGTTLSARSSTARSSANTTSAATRFRSACRRRTA